MKIKYLGSPGEDRKDIEMYGLHFPVGKAIEVSDKFAARKLAKHPHFETKDEITDVSPLVLPQTIPSVEPSVIVTADSVTVPPEHEHGDNHGPDTKSAPKGRHSSVRATA